MASRRDTLALPPTALGRSRLEKLPSEILLAIFKVLGPNQNSNRMSRIRNGMKQLRSLALVSRTLTEFAQRILYRHIFLSKPYQMMQLLRTLVQINPARAPLVFSLDVWVVDGPSPITPLPASMTRVEIARQIDQARLLFDILIRATRLRWLRIRPSGTATVPVQWDWHLSDYMSHAERNGSLARPCPSLETLTVSFESWWDTLWYTKLALFEPFMRLPNFKDLEVLTYMLPCEAVVNGVPVPPSPGVWYVLSRITTLRMGPGFPKDTEEMFGQLHDIFPRLSRLEKLHIKQVMTASMFMEAPDDDIVAPVRNWNSVLSIAARTLTHLTMDVFYPLPQMNRQLYGESGRLTCFGNMTALKTLRVPLWALVGNPRVIVEGEEEDLDALLQIDLSSLRKTIKELKLPPNLERLELMELEDDESRDAADTWDSDSCDSETQDDYDMVDTGNAGEKEEKEKEKEKEGGCYKLRDPYFVALSTLAAQCARFRTLRTVAFYQRQANTWWWANPQGVPILGKIFARSGVWLEWHMRGIEDMPLMDTTTGSGSPVSVYDFFNFYSTQDTIGDLDWMDLQEMQ